MSDPTYEPEECIYKEELEEDGIEYTPNFYWDEDDECWYCENCWRAQ